MVQQPSLSLDGSSGAATILLHPELDVRRREENMRQLLDVANTLTLQEIHDFEMRLDYNHYLILLYFIIIIRYVYSYVFIFCNFIFVILYFYNLLLIVLLILYFYNTILFFVYYY